jgi:ParB family chromosome partitioning protein
MARKNVFSRALEAAQDAQPENEEAAPPADDDRRVAPNVKYFGASFEEQLRRAAQDLNPDEIDMGPFQDRIDLEASLDALVESVRESGQQVPVLVRKTEAGGYVAVYGRRRILACRRLGCPVRAIVTELSEEDALVAQGLENAARLDTSYIEKALFVYRIEQAGFAPGVIQRALGIDKATLSRFRAAARDIPDPVIKRIGAAHGAGRRQWDALRKLLLADEAPAPSRVVEMVDPDLDETDRLSDLIRKLQSRRSTGPTPEPPVARTVAPGLTLKRKPKQVALDVSGEVDPAFLDHLARHLEEALPGLYEAWETKRNEE